MKRNERRQSVPNLSHQSPVKSQDRPDIIVPRPDMTAGEARVAVQKIRQSLETARALLLDLHDRKGWKALGYGSWRECVIAEFQQSQTHLYRQLEAARTEREISPMGEKCVTMTPERVLRPLAGLPAEEKRAAWEDAKARTPGKRPTAKAVQEAVEARKPAPATPVSPEPVPAPPTPDLPTQAVPKPLSVIVGVPHPSGPMGLYPSTWRR